MSTDTSPQARSSAIDLNDSTEPALVSPRYQAWLDAGQPEEIYSIWSSQQWRIYFIEVEGRGPGRVVEIRPDKRAPRLEVVLTGYEDMARFVLRHQTDFTAWLLARVRDDLASSAN